MKGLKPGDHVCWLFDDEQTHDRLSTEFIVDGFNKNSMILCIFTGNAPDHARNSKERVGDMLQGYGVDVDSALSSGQLECVFDTNFDDLDNISRLFTTKAQTALASGYNSVRASIDYFSSIPLRQSLNEAIKDKLFTFEAQLTQLCQELAIIVLCSYNRKRFSDTVLFKQICTHPKAAINSGPSSTNIYFVPPAKLLSGDAHEMCSQSIANFVEYHNKDAKVSQQLSELMEQNAHLQQQLTDLQSAANQPQNLLRPSSFSLSPPSPSSPRSPRTDASTNTPRGLSHSSSQADIHHELRSPLNGIMASASLLAENPGVTPEQRELVDTIEVSSTQLLQVLTDMINLHLEVPASVTATTPPSSSSTTASNPIPIPQSSSNSRNRSPTLVTSPLSSPRSIGSSSSASSSTTTSPLPENFPKNLDILVVEDNAINQTVLKKMLHRLGYQPHIVCDGEAAVELCKTVDYDVIFMDIFLPNMDGLAATKLINGIFENNGDDPDPNSRRRHKPVVVAVTASVTKEIRHECLEVLGMAAFVTKPVRMDSFTNVFTEAILPRLPPSKT